MSEQGDIFRALQSLRSERHKTAHAENLEIIRASGLRFAERPEALLFREPNKPIVDFFPSTGRWRIMGPNGRTFRGGAHAFLSWWAQQMTEETAAQLKEHSAKLVAMIEEVSGQRDSALDDVEDLKAKLKANAERLNAAIVELREARIWAKNDHRHQCKLTIGPEACEQGKGDFFDSCGFGSRVRRLEATLVAVTS